MDANRRACSSSLAGSFSRADGTATRSPGPSAESGIAATSRARGGMQLPLKRAGNQIACKGVNNCSEGLGGRKGLRHMAAALHVTPSSAPDHK
jgi:hypothetical protein